MDTNKDGKLTSQEIKDAILNIDENLEEWA